MGFPDPLNHKFVEWILHGEYYYFAEDIVSFGDELSVTNLSDAYSHGIFPWHIDGMPLPWYCPAKRAILELSELHIPHSLGKIWRKKLYTFTIDQAFRQVVIECSKVPRIGQKGTWITPKFIDAYEQFHKAGMAHSVEVWDVKGTLVGGLYGVDAGGVFCGESMFHVLPNTSKLALLVLIDYLKSRGSTWLDIQVMTPHMKNLGAKEISRKGFLQKLKETQGHELKLF